MILLQQLNVEIIFSRKRKIFVKPDANLASNVINLPEKTLETGAKFFNAAVSSSPKAFLSTE